MGKRGIFFSTDAFIAVTIILIVVLIAYPQLHVSRRESSLPQDVLKTLSSVKVKELSNSQVQTWISQGTVDGEKYLIDQIGILAITDPSPQGMANQLATIALQDLKTNENIGIWYGNTLVFSIINGVPYESAQNINTERYILSGLRGESGTTVSGFSARGFLSSEIKTKYLYFGGYIGDGNITAQVEYNGNLTSAEMEVATNNNFSLYINGVSAGSYIQSPSETVPAKYNLNTYLNSFHEGNNTLEMRGNYLSIAGGFIRITYQSNDTYELAKRYYIPGIDGLINIYDGFYIPSNLSSMEITLDMDSNYTTFLNIGNVTVFNRTTVERELIKLDNAYLLSKLGNYYLLENKTIPLRLGIENLSFIPISQVDVISVTDLSGSMSGQKIADAKTANNLLTDIILNSTKNRVGLASFESYSKKSDFHNLSNVSSSLKNVINNQWNANGYTCICCGILKAISCIDNRTLTDNFNGQTIGSNPIGWTVSDTSNSPINIASDALEGDRAVKVVRGTATPYTYHRFAPQQDDLSIEFRVNNSIESGNTRVRVELEGVDIGGTIYNDYILFKMYNGQIRNGDTAVTPYNINQAYKIKISLVPGSSTYKLYVNDALISSSLQVTTTRDNIAAIRFTTEDSSPPSSHKLNYTFDDVKVYLNKNLCDNTNNKSRAMIAMSDGEANRACGMDPVQDWDGDSDTTNDEQDHAIQAACNAHNIYNFTVHAVAFDITPGSLADTTMQQIATCGGGNYYSSNLTQLLQIYQEIANLIIATYAEQTLTSLVSGVNTKLYPNSYIELKYPQKLNPFGLIVTAENKFSNTTAGNFSLPNGSSILETRVTSYSGSKWTNKVKANNNLVYDITRYGNTFVTLGDPYSINVPNSLILPTGTNNIALSTAVSLTNTSVGSASNKIIYTVIKNFSSFSPIVSSANGCIWTIGFEDGTNITTRIPPSYTGSNICTYQGLPPSYDQNDAFQVAVLNLLKALDFDNNGLVDVQLSAQSLQIDISQVTGIPYTYTTEVQVRTWS